MKEFNAPRSNAYCAALSAIIMVYSLLCWGNLLVNAIDAFSRGIGFSDISRGEDSQPPSGKASPTSTSTTQSLHTRLRNTCKHLDAIAKGAGNCWSSYSLWQSELSKYDAFASYQLTKHVYSCQVIQGKSEKFLFYVSQTDGDTVADFEGSNRYDQSEMNRISKATQTMEGHFKTNEIGTVILVNPNKENVYYEDMPDKYTHASVSRTDELVAYLRADGVNAVYCKKDLLENKGVTQLYYSYDTHWNQAGAYIGTALALRSLGIPVLPLHKRDLDIFKLNGNYHDAASDGLARMIGLQKIFDDENEIIVKGTIRPDWDNPGREIPKVPRFTNPNAPRKEILLVIGDSFRVAMIPLLSEVFADLWVAHRDDYTPEMLKQINPRYIIFEYVERYSNRIGNIEKLIK